MKTGYVLADGTWSGIERKDMPVSKWGRAMCCVYGIIDPLNKGRDMICGRPTNKKWDADAECYEWDPWCSIHKAKAEQSQLDDLDQD